MVLPFASGETQSHLEKMHAKMEPHDCEVPPSRLKALKPLQVPLLVIGLALFAVPATLGWGGFVSNVSGITSDPPFLVSAVVAVLLISVAVIKWQTRGGRTTMV